MKEPADAMQPKTIIGLILLAAGAAALLAKAGSPLLWDPSRRPVAPAATVEAGAPILSGKTPARGLPDHRRPQRRIHVDRASATLSIASARPRFDPGRLGEVLALIGITRGLDRNAAVVQDLEFGGQGLYYPGDPLRGGIVAAIRDREIDIDFDGQRLTLTFEGYRRSDVGDSGLASRKVPAARAARALNNLDDEIEAVRLSAAVAGGRRGLRLEEIAAGSILGACGFQSGDVIVDVAGYPIERPQLLARVYRTMQASPVALPWKKLGLGAMELLARVDRSAAGVSAAVQEVERRFRKGEPVAITRLRGGVAEVVRLQLE